jgi:hypothetical protein
MNRTEAINMIYRHTHPDYKGRDPKTGAKSILVWRDDTGTTAIPIDELTESEFARELEAAKRKKARGIKY